MTDYDRRPQVTTAQNLSEPDYEGAGSKRLEDELKRLIKNAGDVISATMYEPAKGGGWAAVLSTEYAALKVYYRYRHSKVNLDHNAKGWVVSVRK